MIWGRNPRRTPSSCLIRFWRKGERYGPLRPLPGVLGEQDGCSVLDADPRRLEQRYPSHKLNMLRPLCVNDFINAFSLGIVQGLAVEIDTERRSDQDEFLK